jgi:hypothetical protein
MGYITTSFFLRLPRPHLDLTCVFVPGANEGVLEWVVECDLTFGIARVVGAAVGVFYCGNKFVPRDQR